MLEAISSTAISAGQAASRATETQAISPAATTAVQSTDDVGFESVMKQVTSDAIGTLKESEAASISMQGKESTRRVVEALMSAEQALQTAVAVRDKVVQAYQEVVRMSI
jgi:flagellar hook-basal body complex protein FliE